MPYFNFERLKQWEHIPKGIDISQLNLQILRETISPKAKPQDWDYLKTFLHSRDVIYENNNILVPYEFAKTVAGDLRTLTKTIDHFGNYQLIQKNGRSNNGKFENFLFISSFLLMIADDDFSPLETAFDFYNTLNLILTDYENQLLDVSGFFEAVRKTGGKSIFMKHPLDISTLQRLTIVGLLEKRADPQGKEYIQLDHSPGYQEFEEWISQFFEYKFKIKRVSEEPTPKSSFEPEHYDFDDESGSVLPTQLSTFSPESDQFQLHPKLKEVSEALIRINEWSSAILEGLKHFLVDVRKKAELDSSIDNLETLAKAFHINEGCLRLPKSVFSEDTCKSRQEGLFFLATGAVKLLRNLTAHETTKFEKTEGKDWIAMLNRLYYLLDETIYEPDRKKGNK